MVAATWMAVTPFKNLKRSKLFLKTESRPGLVLTIAKEYIPEQLKNKGSSNFAYNQLSIQRFFGHAFTNLGNFFQESVTPSSSKIKY